jgi:hypothetical protein
VLCFCGATMLAQNAGTPRFEDYPVTEVFKGNPVAPILTSPDEKKFETVINQGVNKGWGVFDGESGKELPGPGPNLAGHYILVSFGCGSSVLTDCLMAAIVDAKTGNVFTLPPPETGQMPHFGVFSEFTTNHPAYSFHPEPGRNADYNQLPFRYRLSSRLLLARVCERTEMRGGSIVYGVSTGCGDHFYVMDDDGLKLVYRDLDDDKGPPRFEDYPVTESFGGPSADPVISTPEERNYRTKIREGVTKGYGVAGPDGKERPGPNFAGHHYVVTWGCGSPCLMAAIVDGRTGRVIPPPFHHGPGNSFFQVPWAFPLTPPMDYRLNSRLLIANICEQDRVLHIGNQIDYEIRRCGPHYFLMEESGLTLIYRTLK